MSKKLRNLIHHSSQLSRSLTRHLSLQKGKASSEGQFPGPHKSHEQQQKISSSPCGIECRQDLVNVTNNKIFVNISKLYLPKNNLLAK